MSPPLRRLRRNPSRHVKALLTTVVMGALVLSAAHADILLDETNLVGVNSAAPPSEHDFTAATADALAVTLTDLQAPDPFASLSIVVTLGDAIVAKGTLASGTSTLTLPIAAAAGNYAIRVIGLPNAADSFGTFGVCVTKTADPTPRSCVAAYSFSGNIQTQGSANDPTVSTLSTTFTVPTSGTYIVHIADFRFPAALNTAVPAYPNVAILSGATPVLLGAANGSSMNLTAGTTYTLLALAQADQTLKAGLYGLSITGGSPSAPVFARTLPVGAMAPSAPLNIATAAQLTLKLTDFGYPASLGSAGALVSSGAAPMAVVSATNPSSVFGASAGTVEIWQFATAGAGGTPGAYETDLTSAAANLFSSLKGVGAGTPGSLQSFAYAVNLAAAGTYHVSVNDFLFPSTLQSIKFAVAQGTSIVPTATGGALDVAASAGPLIVIVNAQAPGAGIGLFGVSVQTQGASPQLLLDQTQAVGGVFASRVINLGTSGGFDVTLTDLGFPANFQSLALVVSRAGQVIGKIFGGGTFGISATPGQYVVTFTATPGAQQLYGLYADRIASSAPTVALQASPTSLNTGAITTLTWTVTNADSCAASGGWSGAKASTSGTESVTISSAGMTTFTLTCTGPGGPATQSVTISAVAKPASSSGGGGSLDIDFLALGALLLVARYRRLAH